MADGKMETALCPAYFEWEWDHRFRAFAPYNGAVNCGVVHLLEERFRTDHLAAGTLVYAPGALDHSNRKLRV
jgi:hypothetical protein